MLGRACILPSTLPLRLEPVPDCLGTACLDALRKELATSAEEAPLLDCSTQLSVSPEVVAAQLVIPPATCPMK